MSQRKEMGRRKGVTNAGHSHILLLVRNQGTAGIMDQESGLANQESGVRTPESGIGDQESGLREHTGENWLMCGR